MIEFKKPNINQIQDLIQKELKDIEYKSLSIKPAQNIELDPIYTLANHTINIPMMLDYRINFQLFTIEEIKVEEINLNIISALQNGANGLIINANHQDISEDSIRKLFKNIQFEYIHTEFLNTNKNLIQTIKSYFQSYTSQLNSLNLAYSNQVYCISNDNFIQEASDFIFNSKHSRANIHIELSGDYFWDICKIRAFKILMHNYLLNENLPAEILIIGETTVKNKTSENVEINILKSTTEAMASIVGGSDGIWVKPFDGQNNDFSQRISRNIFNLMNEESYLTLVNDPSYGSYFIENYTEKIAREIFATNNPS